METIEMSRHAFASSHLPHRASLRRFPQRSQSLRVKSSSPSISRMAPRWNGAPSSTTIMPTSRLLLTGKCLIVQDSGASSSSTHPEASFSKPILTSGPGGFQGKTTMTSQEPQPSRVSLPYTSVTLQRTRSSANSSSSVALTRCSASQTSTLFVNCSLPPNTISASLDRNVQGDPVDGSSPTTKSSPLGGENLLTCSTFSEDTTSDEGVLTSFTEDYLEESEEEDEEEYLKLETVFHSGHGYGNGGSCGEHSHRRVHLLRHAHLGLGLSITGGSEDALPVTVASVKADSPADRCHLIYVGDQIVSVNEVTLDETICHADARRLLAECGDKVCLVLKHSQAVSSFRRRWRRRKRMPAQKPLEDSQTTVDSSGKSSGGAQEQVDNPSNPTTGQDSPWRPLGRSSSVSSFGSSQPFDLFLGGITRYVTYSNQLRDCSFEVRTGSCSTASTPLVVQCSNEDICTQWMDAIKGAIDSLTEEYMSFFNGQYPQREHIFYMGWVSECITPDGSSHLLSPTQHHLASRWLSRYLIIKGGTVYLFKVPPISLLRSTKGRLVASSRRNHSGSSGTSLGSVGSSASEATTSSSSSSSTGSAHFSLSHASESNDRLASGRPGRRGGQSERVQRINRDLDRQLAAEAMETLACYKTDFRTVHLKEALASGLKGHVFQLNSGTTPATTKKRFFSTENAANLASLQQAWTRANYHSVIHFKTKTFTVVLEEENVFGSLILDWRFGFSFYDPKRKQYLWSYKFHQLRSSFDDGQSRLSLTFAVDGSPEQTRTHVLQSAALPVLLCCTEAFLAAKVYTLCL